MGFDNYVEVFTDPDISAVFYVSLYYFAASFLQIGLALYFATVLSFNTRFRNLFKGILFFPYLINGVAIGFVFLYFFQPGGDARHGPVRGSASTSRPAVARRPGRRELLARRHVACGATWA